MDGGDKPSLGSDLIVPVLALAFAAYFFVSISGLAWEAKANGMLIGTVLVALSLLQIGRIILRARAGEADLGFATLLEPRRKIGQRLGMVALIAAFIAAMPWLGLTLAVFLAMCVGLLLMGVTRFKPLFLVAGLTALAAYLMFIAVLDSDFPRGPIEWTLRAIARAR